MNIIAIARSIEAFDQRFRQRRPYLHFVVTETLTLLALGCFLACVAVWAAVFIWGV